MSEGKSRAQNCLVYGCLTMVVVVIIMGLVGVFGVRYGYKKIVESYTSPTPVQVPVVQYTPEEWSALTNRLGLFKLQAAANTNEITLSLSARDINILLNQRMAQNPKEQFNVQIEKDTIRSQISLPLDRIGLDALKGRYVNGMADIKVGIIDGVPDVRITGLEVNGNKVPGTITGRLSDKNLFENGSFDPDTEKVLKRVEKLTVEDGQILLKLKPLPPNDAPAVVAPPRGTI